MNLALWLAAFKRKRPAAKMNMQAVCATLRNAAAAVLLSWPVWWSGTGIAQELVHFPSWEDNGAGQAATVLDGYLYRPEGPGPHAAIVGLHGCSGMFVRGTSTITPIYSTLR